jgi:hypothetical protein
VSGREGRMVPNFTACDGCPVFDLDPFTVVGQRDPYIGPSLWKGSSVLASAYPIALTAAAVDGPILIGDAIGAVIFAGATAGATAYDATQRTFVTYTMRNPAGQTYVGRTSGYGDPFTIMNKRASGHHMKAFGFANLP